MRRITAAIAVIAVFVIGDARLTTAAAALLSYDFTVQVDNFTLPFRGTNLDINAIGNNQFPNSISTADGTGKAGTGTLGVTLSGGPAVGSKVSTGFQGVGVFQGAFDNVSPRSARIDVGDVLTLVFAQPVNLTSLFFGAVDANDQFSLSVDGSAFLPTQLIGASSTETKIAVGAFGTTFAITGGPTTNNAGGCCDFNGYRLAGAEVDVPEPSTLGLIGFGLLGLGAMRRRRSPS